MSTPAPEQELSGRVLDGRFRIDGILGEGGMGRVYSATQLSLGRSVAIKTIRCDPGDRDRAQQRFRREALLTSRVVDPHVITLHDFGVTDDGVMWMAVERLHGVSLADRLEADGALPEAQALTIASQVARGLAAAAEHGVVHRDLKPDNIWLSTGTFGVAAKVMDFGIARAVQGPGKTTLTAAGHVVGTPAYMAPEQARGDETDGRADIYALGVVLFEMLTGRRLFDSSTPMGLLLKQVSDPPPALAAHAPQLRTLRESAALLDRMLEKHPFARPWPPQALAGTLQALAAVAADQVAAPSAPVLEHPLDATPEPATGASVGATRSLRAPKADRQQPHGGGRGAAAGARSDARAADPSLRSKPSTPDAGDTRVPATADGPVRQPAARPLAGRMGLAALVALAATGVVWSVQTERSTGTQVAPRAPPAAREPGAETRVKPGLEAGMAVSGDATGATADAPDAGAVAVSSAADSQGGALASPDAANPVLPDAANPVLPDPAASARARGAGGHEAQRGEGTGQLNGYAKRLRAEGRGARGPLSGPNQPAKPAGLKVERPAPTPAKTAAPAGPQAVPQPDEPRMMR